MSHTITDVAGITVGHAHDAEAITGVTVLLAPEGAAAGVDVRGGAPGTRETDLLSPVATVEQIHALALCGGSAMGLAAVTGVMEWLREQGVGFDVGIARVPIVPAAVIFDLSIGRPDRFPDAAMGRAACANAGSIVAEGNVGAGIGATVGKALGLQYAMKGGVGTWSEQLPDGTTVGALVVVNAWGDIRDDSGAIIAGARSPAGGFADASRLMRSPLNPLFNRGTPQEGAGQNTTLAVVATDAQLTKAACTKLAQMAQDGLARAIRPAHTPFDGDLVFSLATGRRPAPHMLILGSIAAEVLARAVERAVQAAETLGGVVGLK